jgi:beta-lactamase class A
MPPVILSRRIALLGIASSICISRMAVARIDDSDFAKQLAALEQRLGGRIGVQATDTGTGATLAYREHERFAMCSIFKLLLAAAVLWRVDRGRLSLTQQVAFTATDILDHAPVCKAYLAAGRLPIAALIAAIIEVSDNTAANLLLKLIDGPPGLTVWLKNIGDTTTRLDRFETELNSNLPGDERDTTTAAAMMSTMKKLLVDGVLKADSRAMLIERLKTCSTGLERLRAGLPTDWVAGDKTGSGANGAVNDVAIIWPPQRAPILIAVYLSGSAQPLATLNAAHAQISKLIAAQFSKT